MCLDSFQATRVEASGQISHVQRSERGTVKGTDSFCFLMNYKNLMFILQTQKSRSASFAYRKSAVSATERLRAAQDFPTCSKCVFFFFLKQHFGRTSTSSLVSSTCKHVVYLHSLMGLLYIPYGFFESSKNKAKSKKVHQKTKVLVPVCDLKSLLC